MSNEYNNRDRRREMSTRDEKADDKEMADSEEKMSAYANDRMEKDGEGDLKSTLNCQNVFQEYNPKQYYEKRWGTKEDSSHAEYYNCVFVNGGQADNAIFNTGNINGGISQNNSVDSNRDTRQAFDEIGLERFLETYSETSYISVLVALISIRLLPTYQLLTLANELEQCLYPSQTSANGNVVKRHETFISVQNILKTIGAERVMATVKSEAGNIEVEFSRLRNTEANRDLRGQIWNEYPGMRKGIIDWLLRLGRNTQFRSYLLFYVVESVACFAAMDFLYCKSNIIPRFTQGKNKDDLYFLEAIMGECLKTGRYSKNAEALLCHWSNLEDNDFLWKTALALSFSGQRYGFNQLLSERLVKIVRREIQMGEPLEIGQTVYLFTDSSKIPFHILQRNKRAAVKYIEILAEQFCQCRQYQEQIRFGYYFMMLMWEDYIAEGFPEYRSLLIDSLNWMETKNSLAPVFRFVWSKRTFRKVFIEPILAKYFNEIERKSISWEYMKRFLRVVAFTGRREDYGSVIDMFSRMQRDNMSVRTASLMQVYVSCLLEHRKDGEEERNGNKDI